MAKTYLDEIVSYPQKAINLIGSSKECCGLLLNKRFDAITDNDHDDVFDRHLFTYQYVDNTTQTATAYVWAEVDIPNIQNQRIKDLRLYITVAAHKQFMNLDRRIHPGMAGNRRDNLVRHIDKLLNFQDIFGIGKLAIRSVKTVNAPNGFVIKEIEYEIPDFNFRRLE